MLQNSQPSALDNLVTIICCSFSIVFVNDFLMTHLRSILLSYDYSQTLLSLWSHSFSHPLHIRQSIVLVVWVVYGLVLYSLALILLERLFSPTALQTSGIKQNRPISVPLAPPKPAPFPLPSSSSSRTNTGRQHLGDLFRPHLQFNHPSACD